MQLFKRIWNEPNLGDQVAAIAVSARSAGAKEGYEEGFNHCLLGRTMAEAPLAGRDTEAEYEQNLRLFEEIKFPVLDIIEECSRLPDPVASLREYFEESDLLGERLAKEAADKASGVGSSGAGGLQDEEEEELIDYD